VQNEQRLTSDQNRLFGRDSALSSLRKAYEDAVGSGLRFLLIEGEIGSGKSALAESLRTEIERKHGAFIHVRSKYEQRNVPYQALAEGLSDYFGTETFKDPLQVNALRTKLVKALGAEISVISHLIPAIHMDVGRLDDRMVVRPSDQRDRVSIALQNLIAALSSPGNPVVLFLDDLQWADSPGRQLILNLLTSVHLSGVLVIAGLRTTDLSTNHPARSWLTDLAQARVRYSRIALANLTLIDVKSFLRNRLGKEYDFSADLAELIFAKTHGSPFFIHQFYGFLTHAGALRGRQSSWTYDAIVGQELSPTANVFEVIVGRVNSLSSATRTILGLASCLAGKAGTKFFFVELLLVSRWARKGLDEALKEAYEAGLIALAQIGQYQFTHERIHAAAYKMLTPRERALNHYKIASAMHQATDEKELPQVAHLIAFHYGAGIDYVDTTEEMIVVAKINNAAARSARMTQNWELAGGHIEAALEILPELNWEVYGDLLYQIYLIKAETASYRGDLGAADEIFGFLLRNVKDAPRVSEIYQLAVSIKLTLGQFHGAIECGLKGLRALGLPMKEQPSRFENSRLMHKLRSRIEELGSQHIEAIRVGRSQPWDRLLAVVSVGACFENHPHLNTLILRACLRTLDQGLFDGSWSLLNLGLGLLNSRFGTLPETEALAEVTLKAVRNTNAFEEHLVGFSAPACALVTVKSMKVIVDILANHFESVKNSGFSFIAMSSSLLAGEWSIFSGQPLLSAELSLEGYLKFAQQHKSSITVDGFYVTLVAIHALRGNCSSSGSFSTPSLSEDGLVKRLKTHATTIPYTVYLLRRIWVDYTMGCYERGICNLEKARESIIALPFSFEKSIFYACSALLMATSYQNSGPWKKVLLKRSMRSSLRDIRRARDGHSETLEWLVQGEYDRVCSRYERAKVGFQTAVKFAKENRFIHLEALGEELLGRLSSHLSTGSESVRHFERAKELYLNWGATAKCEQLEAQLGLSGAGQNQVISEEPTFLRKVS
jgi:hypothetical protein